MVAYLRYGRSFGNIWKVVEKIVATYSRCAVVTHWLLYTPIQKRNWSFFEALENLVLSFFFEDTN